MLCVYALVVTDNDWGYVTPCIEYGSRLFSTESADGTGRPIIEPSRLVTAGSSITSLDNEV